MSKVLSVMVDAVERHGEQAATAFVEEKAGEVPDALTRFVDARFAAVGYVEVVKALTVADLREVHSRPLRMLRTIASMTEEETAQALGWSIEQVRASEQLDDIPAGSLSLVEYMLALGKMALTLSARVSNQFNKEAWNLGSGGDDGLNEAEWLAYKWATGGGGVLQRQGIEVEHLG